LELPKKHAYWTKPRPLGIKEFRRENHKEIYFLLKKKSKI